MTKHSKVSDAQTLAHADEKDGTIYSNNGNRNFVKNLFREYCFRPEIQIMMQQKLFNYTHQFVLPQERLFYTPDFLGIE